MVGTSSLIDVSFQGYISMKGRNKILAQLDNETFSYFDDINNNFWIETTFTEKMIVKEMRMSSCPKKKCIIITDGDSEKIEFNPINQDEADEWLLHLKKVESHLTR